MTPAFTTPQEGSPNAPAHRSALDADELHTYAAPVARAILLHALSVGVAADLLLRDGFTGLGFPLWLAILALNVVSLVWRDGRQIPRETAAWLGLAILWGAAMAWRGSPSLQFLDFVATLFCLGMAAVSLADPRAALLADRMRDTTIAGLRVIHSVIVGVVPLALRDAALAAALTPLRGRFHPALRATLIALPLLLVFGALLRDADPLFASVIALPDIDLGTLISHVVVIGFFGWVTAGWARGAMLATPAPRLPEQLPFSLGALDVTAALGALNALFAAYVLTQLGWFFGGERFLQAQTGLTAAQYARQGFFQMVWVVLLVVPVLLTTRAALRPDPALARRHTALALPLLALLGVMIVSALLRLQLYVQYYGLTLDRFYPLVFMGWLVIVLSWLVLTVLRGHGRPFAAGAVASGLAILLALNVVVPDVVVARVNVARGAVAPRGSTTTVDLAHLASLGAEATPFTVAAVLSAAPSSASPAAADSTELARCNAATALLGRWGPTSRMRAAHDTEWRRWNRGETLALGTVGANAAALRTVRHDACGRVRAAGGPRPTARGGR